MTDTRSLITIARDELDSDVCAACGGEKKKRQSFCRQCYFSLPKAMQMSLYKPFSEGYAEIYDEAKDWLKINKPETRRM